MSLPSSTWERALHPRIRESPDLRRRAAIVAAGSAFALAFVVGQVVLLLVAGHLSTIAPVLTYLVVPCGVLLLLRHRPDVRPAAHLLTGSSSALIAVAVMGENRIYAGTVVWFGVVCAMAIMALGVRAGLWWLVADAVVSSACARCRNSG